MQASFHAVQLVAFDRVPNARTMHAELMRATGQRPQSHKSSTSRRSHGLEWQALRKNETYRK